MKHDPKIVEFNRSAEFAYHRALRNQRENNPLDALELMRSAVERDPEKMEYRVRLISKYNDMGCYSQAIRMVLDMLAQGNASEKMYLVLAAMLLHEDRTEAARNLLSFALREIHDEEIFHEAHRFLLRLFTIDNPEDFCPRRILRLRKMSERAQRYAENKQFEQARTLFEKCVSQLSSGEVRIQYADTLNAMGETEQAVSEIETALCEDDSLQTRISAANSFHAFGNDARARALLREVAQAHPDTDDCIQMLRSMDMLGMYSECAQAARMALQTNPYSKELLHIRAVALSRTEAGENRANRYWLRILRIDPDDAVARYYLSAAEDGTLKDIDAEILYRIPHKEALRRMELIQKRASGGTDALAQAWSEDCEFRMCVQWAAQTDDPRILSVALLALCGCNDESAKSCLRTMLLLKEIPVSLKAHALVIAHMRQNQFGGELEGFFTACMSAPDADVIYKSCSVGERRLLEGVSRYLALYYGLNETALPAFLWFTFRHNPNTVGDLTPSMEAAMGALIYHCLTIRRQSVNISTLHKRIGGSKRKMLHYIQRLERAIGSVKGENLDEDIRF